MGTTYDVVGGDEIDGVPVRSSMQVLSLPRWHGAFNLNPLPMAELREDGDAGAIAARWPEPFPDHELEARRD